MNKKCYFKPELQLLEMQKDVLQSSPFGNINDNCFDDIYFISKS